MNPATKQQAAMARSPVRHAMMMTGRRRHVNQPAWAFVKSMKV